MNNSDCIHEFSAPGRTELAGNHTDHNNGKVLAAPIQLRITAQVQKKDDNTVQIYSAGFPDVIVKLKDDKRNDNLHPKPEETGTTNALVRGIAAEFKKRGYPIGGFSANTESNVLPGSGLSSSAALEVLIVRIFDSLYGEEKLSVLETAQIGQIAENIYFEKPCGLMDQIACASKGAVSIDFVNNKNPIIKQIKFDPSAAGYTLCIVNTGGSHADLTADYASIPADMKAVAAFFGKSVLRELDKETVLSHAAEIRKALGDRALLRAIHFFDENERVDKMTSILLEMESAVTVAEKEKLFNCYLELVNESGDSSWKLLQNVYSPHSPEQQGISTALALTKDFFRKQKLFSTNKVCACRVHGGGFAGTVQVYLPLGAMDAYCAFMERVFGAGAVIPDIKKASGE
ncbi:MAG: galactokinase [Treponema sp.]|nr:galactokinase [Treponema sp.]MCL2252308.1 galactokinase [Treponema sp.]